MIAIIPSIGRSPHIKKLIETLLFVGPSIVSRILVVDNHPESPENSIAELGGFYHSVAHMWRPTWSVYRTWNFGLDLGEMCREEVLVLNDDVIINPKAFLQMFGMIKQRPWALLGFDYNQYDPPLYRKVAEEIAGTYRQGGLGGFAFAANPQLCARVDERFQWWGGDDDLVHATIKKGGLVGLARGVYVLHPDPSISAEHENDLRPDGWHEHDRALLLQKWGETW